MPSCFASLYWSLQNCKQRKVIIGFEYCFQHLKSERHLTVGNSLIPGAGKGLFAYDPRNPNGNEIATLPADDLSGRKYAFTMVSLSHTKN